MMWGEEINSAEQKQLLTLLYKELTELRNGEANEHDKLAFTDRLLLFVDSFEHAMKQQSEINQQQREKRIERMTVENMHHITFSLGHQQLLVHMLKKSSSTVHVLDDVLSIGPLNEHRTDWLFERGLSQMNRAMATFTAEIRSIAVGHSVVIWVANNAHEKLALSYTLTHLPSDLSIRIIDIPASDMEVGNLVYRSSSDLCAKDVVSHFNRSIEMDALPDSERKSLQKRWQVARNSIGCLRIWQNCTIIEVEEAFYDEKITQLATNEYSRSIRIIGEIICQSDDYLSKEWLYYRVNYLIAQGILQCAVDSTNLFNQRIKLASGVS
ncbi:DUF3658 domain-containing protein [Kurthia sibirica]|nr:DUF3658 domain-containing protein [Kurthia sibirica]GEK33581.1 hypothetical protein KSI01_11140 [Kurthia sibirica]